MKILFIVPRFHPELGGVEKHVYCVAEKLTKSGNEITIMTSTDRDDLKSNERINGIEIYRNNLPNLDKHSRISVFLRLGKMMLFLLRHFTLIKSHDVIHLHDPVAFLWVIPIIPFLGKRIFITFHGFEGYPVQQINKIIRKMAEKFTRGNICVGDFIHKWYGTKPTFTIVGGVEVNKKIQNNSSDESAVFVGRLEQDTGILDFLDCLYILKNNHGIDLPLHICGDGSLRSKVIQSAKDHSIRIVLHGFVENVMPYIVRSRYAFVTGYLSILEAMYCKRPVFSIYDNPLKKDYLYSIPETDTLMFVAGSSPELADKIYNVIKSDEYVKPILEKAFTFANNQSWDKIAHTYLNLYKNN